MAERFVNAIDAKDYDLAESMFTNFHREILADRVAKLGDPQVTVKVAARRWRDFWRLKRRLLLQVIPNSPNPKGFRVGLQADLAATPFGIQRSEMYAVTFK
jgi:hypothetical protein